MSFSRNASHLTPTFPHPAFLEAVHVEFVDAVADATLLPFAPVLAELVARRAVATGLPQFLLRRQRPYFLLGPRDRRLPRLDQAVAWAAAEGFPVYRRLGGGSLVLLDEGCLAFAAAVPARDPTRVEALVHRLTAPVRAALEAMGVDARFGAAPGAYCEGPWDLLLGGRKVAGVAAAVRGGFCLVSGMLLVDQPPELATRRVNDFYAAGGGGRPFLATAVTRLADAAPDVSLAAVAHAVRAALGHPAPRPVSEAERRTLGRLLGLRRSTPERPWPDVTFDGHVSCS